MIHVFLNVVCRNKMLMAMHEIHRLYEIKTWFHKKIDRIDIIFNINNFKFKIQTAESYACFEFEIIISLSM